MTDEEFLLDRLISINLRRNEARKLYQQWETEWQEFRPYSDMRGFAEKEALGELRLLAWRTVEDLDGEARKTMDDLKHRLLVKTAALLQAECRQIDGRD